MLKSLVFTTFMVLTVSAFGKVYDFKELYAKLGYSAENDFFGPLKLRQSIETYIDKSDTFYSEINSYLRFHPAPYSWNGTSPAMAKKISIDIDKVLLKTPILPRDLMVFRGINLGWRGNKSYDIGEEFTEKAYSSTSTSFNVAEFFAKGNENDTTSKRALLAIYFNGSKIHGLMIDKKEDEVLLPRNLKFRIMDFKINGKYDFYLVQACLKKCQESVTDEEINSWWESR